MGRRLISVTVADVGHGNCAYIETPNYRAVVDAPSGGIIDEILSSRGINDIDDLIISHGDSDHCAGAATLLAGNPVSVKNFYLNPEPIRHTDTWDDLMAAAHIAADTRRVQLHTRLETGMMMDTDGQVGVEVIAPSPSRLLAGGAGVKPGGKLKIAGARTADANSLSAAVRITAGGRGLVLLPGDLDTASLDAIESDGLDIHSEILVFPHHGGLPGRYDAEDFARRLLARVAPEIVIFSVGRERQGFPGSSIIRLIASQNARTRIACTQLVNHCVPKRAEAISPFQSTLAGAGVKRQHACAGTMNFTWSADGSARIDHPVLTDHETFINTYADRPMCKVTA